MRNIDKANAVMRVAWELDQAGVDAESLTWEPAPGGPRVAVYLPYIEDVEVVAKAHGLTLNEDRGHAGLYLVEGQIGPDRVHVYSGLRHRPATEPAPKRPRLQMVTVATATRVPAGTRLGDWSAVADAAWAQGVAP